MAGFFFQGLNEAERGNDLAALRTRATPVQARDGLVAPVSDSGAFTNQLPVTLRSDVDRNGFRSRSFFEHYYNRIHFIPSVVAFGALSSETSQDVAVWNAYLTSKTITAIAVVGDDGVTIDGPALPYAMKSLEIATYSFSVTLDGAATVAASVGFTVDGESLPVAVTGARARLSPLAPNWRQPYEVEYQFKTDTVMSRSGKEQRRSLRVNPRKTVSFEATPTFSVLRSFNELMASWHNNVVILPELPRQALLSSAMAPGAAIANLTGPVPDWVVPDISVVLAYDGRYETRRVDGAAGSQVTFSNTSASEWPVGTKLHPGLAGRLAATIRGRRETNEAAAMTVQMDVTPGSEVVLAAPVAPATFNGRELFDVKPNWAERPEVEHESLREEIDYGRGLTAVFSPIPYARQQRKLTFTGRDYASAKLLLDHFTRMKGRRGEFYMPTGDADVIPKIAAAPGTNTVRVKGREFSDAYADSTVYKALKVTYADGAVQYNVVQSVYLISDGDGTDSGVQVASVWDQEVSQENAVLISWMPVWRHATDSLTMQWLTNSVAQCQFNVQTLEDLP